ncbi:MAG: redox-sensitive transcriptional activator SoxR [Chloroflexi bacterium]|nr:redox-sensitive transcriptional activator SoxR [Chloroflexota bacterium]
MPPKSRPINSPSQLTIGEVASRSGVATSAIRFYESVGLIESERSEGNQRRFQRSVIRRVAVIKAAQRAGVSLEVIGRALSELPVGRAPSRGDWERLSRSWERDLEARIARLVKIRDHLTNCIGCGCLSLDTCALFNPEDELAESLAGTSKLESVEMESG